MKANNRTSTASSGDGPGNLTETEVGGSLDRAIDEGEAGGLLGLKRITMIQHRLSGKGPRHFRIGRAVRYRLGDVLAYRDARMVGGAK